MYTQNFLATFIKTLNIEVKLKDFVLKKIAKLNKM